MDAAEALPERMTRATKEALSVHHFLDQLLDVELSAREERRVKTELVPVRIAQRSNAGQLRLRLPALGGALAHRDTRHLRLGARQGD
jgi:hypothetical protein